MKPRRITAIFAVAVLQHSLLSAQPASILPPCRLETLTSSDGSGTLCFTVDGRAGFHYTLQESNDLATWRDVTSFHSLGHVHTHPLLRTATPPTPDPTSPTAEPPSTVQTHTAAILLQPAPGGGTLACWNSFENQTLITVRLETTLDTAWPLIPLYFQDHGNFHLFARQPDFPLADPGPENPPLNGLDELLFETLAGHLPSMNTQVADSVATSRKAPPPAPSDPGSRLFVRLKVTTLDSDGDGVRDDIEYLLASQNHPLAHPFNPDVDGNGTPDGDQIDSDNDNTPDGRDIDPTDASDPGEILPITRFALFPIIGGRPLAISDNGTVLLENATWRAGDVKPVRGIGIAINDHDQILSLDSKTFETTGPDGKKKEIVKSVYYASKTHGGSAEPVADSAGYHAGHYTTFTSETRGLLSNDGVFTANSLLYGQEYDPDGHNAFRISNSGSANRLTRPPEIFFSFDEDLSWGYGKVIIRGNAVLGFPSVAVRDGKDESIVRALSSGIAFKYYNNQWQPDPRYDWAIDIAKDGTAIGRHERLNPRVPQDQKIPIIQINGQWTAFEKAVPEAESWIDETSLFLDMSPSGWAILRQGIETLYTSNGQLFIDPTYPDMNTGVLMPIRIKGVAPAGGAPEATGVDDVSIAAPDPGPAVGNKLWIMAPTGGSKTKLILETNASQSSPVKLSAPGIQFNNQPEATLTSAISTVEVSATDPTKSGQEIMATIKLGTAESVSQPIALKIMKSRTVKITIHPVASVRSGADPGDPDQPPEMPDPLPSESAIEAHMNSAYKTQMNASFDVTIRPVINLKWDVADNLNGAYDPHHHVTPGNRQLDFNTAVSGTEPDFIHNSLKDSDAHINIYYLGGGKIISKLVFDGYLQRLNAINYGIARNEDNVVFMDGNMDALDRVLLERDPTAERIHTITHECGHCIVGDGHPDQEGGPAPLKGLLPASAVSERVMVSGNNVRRPNHGRRFVKGEWDMAEIWLKRIIDDPN